MSITKRTAVVFPLIMMFMIGGGFGAFRASAHIIGSDGTAAGERSVGEQVRHDHAIETEAIQRFNVEHEELQKRGIRTLSVVERREHLLDAVDAIRERNEQYRGRNFNEEARKAIEENDRRILEIRERAERAKTETELKERIAEFRAHRERHGTEVKIRILKHYIEKLEEAIAAAERRSGWIANRIGEIKSENIAISVGTMTDMLAGANGKIAEAKRILAATKAGLPDKLTGKEFSELRRSLNDVKNMLKEAYALFRGIANSVKATEGE
jgi:hypothetical protein